VYVRVYAHADCSALSVNVIANKRTDAARHGTVRAVPHFQSRVRTRQCIPRQVPCQSFSPRHSGPARREIRGESRCMRMRSSARCAVRRDDVSGNVDSFGRRCWSQVCRRSLIKIQIGRSHLDGRACARGRAQTRAIAESAAWLR